MYLVSLELENVRAIRSMKLDFRSAGKKTPTRRWTVLLGENGCGKSTVLKSIGLLLAGSEALPDLLGLPDQWINTHANEAKLSAIIATAEGELRNIALTLTRGDGRDVIIKKNEQGLHELDAAIRHADRNYFIAGYGAFRRPPDLARERFSSQGWQQGRAPQLATLFSSSQDLVSLEQWAMDLDYRSGDSGKDIIASCLKQLLPGMTFKEIDKNSRSLIMSTVDGDVPLRQLSEGYQSMAAWAGDLLFRMTETFKERLHPLDARGVLLLDEMDLHLHPVWKRNLVEFLNTAFPNLQVIATTHSPLSIQQCGEGELFVVKRENSEPTLVAFKGDPSNMRLSDLFLSPLIGLDTLDSPKVAALREAATKIELKSGRRSPADLKKLTSIHKQLEGTATVNKAEMPSFSQLIRVQKQLQRESPLKLIRENEALFGSSQTLRRPATAKHAEAKKSSSASTSPRRAVGSAKTAARKAPSSPVAATTSKSAATPAASKRSSAAKPAKAKAQPIRTFLKRAFKK